MQVFILKDPARGLPGLVPLAGAHLETAVSVFREGECPPPTAQTPKNCPGSWSSLGSVLSTSGKGKAKGASLSSQETLLHSSFSAQRGVSQELRGSGSGGAFPPEYITVWAGWALDLYEK